MARSDPPTRHGGLDIPEAELAVLSALWRLGEGTVRDVLDDLRARQRRLAYNTVLTLLGRLEKRGYAECDREGLANIYRPRISRERVAGERWKSLVRQLADDAPGPLILKMVEASALSLSDIRELRKLLTRLEREAPEDPST